MTKRNWMERRKFLRTLIATGGAWWSRLGGSPAPGQLPAARSGAPGVKRVLAVFKCHFDAGFIDTQAAVVKRYFDDYFPKAINTAEGLSRAGKQRYVWTTGSWLLYEYLERAGTEQRKKMEQAIESGYIAWHALPFTWQSELMDPTLIGGAIALSQSLDRRFGKTTTGAKSSDVPGHTRGIIAPLSARGVKFLDIGVNEASRPAILPPLFRWRDPQGATLVVMYHSGYGGVVAVPGSDFAVALEVKDDNSGPHSLEEIAASYSALQQKFPNAELIATDLTRVADELQPYAGNLPVVTQEIGDTWIHGIASDPLKVSRYRELCRLRQAWIAEGKLRLGDASDVKLLRHLLLEVEHTWGTDTKTWLDFDAYTVKDLEAKLGEKNYQIVASSWLEKRRELFSGIDTLPPVLKREAKLAMASLEPRRPRPVNSPRLPPLGIETAHFLIQLDESSGAIRRLLHKKRGREWASPDHLLAQFSYQTLSQEDYANFFKSYVISDEDWAQKDFGKPNIERFGAESRFWKPVLVRSDQEESKLAHRFLTRLEIGDSESLAAGRAAFPKEVFVEYLLPKSKPVVEITLSWFGKPPTRLPEALWLSFDPPVPHPEGWSLRKSGQEVSPFDVVDSGNRHMHAVSDRVSWKDRNGGLSLITLDAPLVALGRPSPLNFSRREASLDGGVHFNLFNNAWGTNYIMWFGEEMRFRFEIHL